MREIFSFDGLLSGTKSPEAAQHSVYIPGTEVFGPLGEALSAWTERLGHRVVRTDERRDQASIELLPEGLGLQRADRRWISVSAHRGPSLVQTAEKPSAQLNGHHGLLDLAFCYAELLFGSRAAQRRYGRSFAQLEVEIVREDAVLQRRGMPPGLCSSFGRSTGRILGISRCGAWLETSEVLRRGQKLDLLLDEQALGDLPVRPMQLSGRVLSEDDGRGFVGLEFDFDAGEGLPSFRSLSRRMSSRIRPALI